jgi:hypothetical protein
MKGREVGKKIKEYYEKKGVSEKRAKEIAGAVAEEEHKAKIKRGMRAVFA